MCTPAVTSRIGVIRAKLSILASAKQDQLHRFANTHSSSRSTAVAEAIITELQADPDVTRCDVDAVETLGAEVYWPAEGTLLTLSDNRGSKKSIWITMNIHWVYPHSPALWRHLHECAIHGTQPIVTRAGGHVAPGVRRLRLRRGATSASLNGWRN